MIRPLRWAGGALEILDQTRLPAHEVWLRCETAEDVAQAIERLEVRGAPAIGIAAAYGLALGVAEDTADPVEARFERAHARLAATRPTAVNLAWALERARRAFTACVADGGAAGPADALRELADGLLPSSSAPTRRWRHRAPRCSRRGTASSPTATPARSPPAGAAPRWA